MFGRYRGTRLQRSIDRPLITMLDRKPLLRYGDMVLIRAWANFFLYGGVLTGPFPANTLATRNIGGQVCGQFEGTRINREEKSQDITVMTGGWTAYGGGTGTAGDVGADPLGNVTADRVTLGADANSCIYKGAGGPLVPPIPGSPATISGWMCTESGTKTFRLGWTDRDGVDQLSADFTATTAWQYFSFSIASVGVGGASLYNKIVNGSAGAAGSILVWGIQLEEYIFSSSYIPTAGSVITRPPDVGYWPAAKVPAAIKNATGPWSVDVYPEWSSAESPIAAYVMSWINDWFGLVWSVNRFQWWAVGGMKGETAALTFSRNQKMAITIDPIALTITISGATTGNGTTPLVAFAGTGAADVYCGISASLTYPFFGLLSEPY